MSEKILFDDDEPNVLVGVRHRLRRRYAVVTAEGPEADLAALSTEGAALGEVESAMVG
ncbi:MAG: hypothetical protein MJB57_00415 [Gemmatimonadetes bacterium]|nr:hypothetical protein [Gemmatimonadota bacterium]